jgi:hypothetical protein
MIDFFDQTVILGEIFIGFGNRPVRHPAQNVDLLTGINSNTDGNLRNPISLFIIISSIFVSA